MDMQMNKLRTVVVTIRDKWPLKDKAPFKDSYTCELDPETGEVWKRQNGRIWVRKGGTLYNAADGYKAEWYPVPNSEDVSEEDVAVLEYLAPT